MIPNDLAPWHTVYQQAQRWMKAGSFEAMAHDLRKLLRLFAQKNAEPLAAITATAKHGIDLMVVKLDEAKRGFVLLPRRWLVERSFAWTARFRRLARYYERLPSPLAGLHWLPFSCLLLNALFRQSA